MYFLVAGQVLIKTEALAEAEGAAKVVVHMRVQEVQEIRQQHLLMAGMERHQTHNRVVMEAQVQLVLLVMEAVVAVVRKNLLAQLLRLLMLTGVLEVLEHQLQAGMVALGLLLQLVGVVLLMLPVVVAGLTIPAEQVVRVAQVLVVMVVQVL